MKFPSLFRLPKSQQFYIKPRYYDPVKEERERRNAQTQLLSNATPESTSRTSRITFERKSSVGMQTSLLQLVIALIISVLIVGWLFIGNQIVYYALFLTPVYLYFRLRRK
jgi:hypothetical protein